MTSVAVALVTEERTQGAGKAPFRTYRYYLKSGDTVVDTIVSEETSCTFADVADGTYRVRVESWNEDIEPIALPGENDPKFETHDFDVPFTEGDTFLAPVGINITVS